MNEQLQQALADLASSLGTTTEYLWGVLLKQAPIAGVSYVAGACIATAITVACFLTIRWSIRALRRDDYDHWDDVRPVMGLVLGCLFGLLAVAFAVGFATYAFTAFVNPEYWALKEILSSL